MCLLVLGEYASAKEVENLESYFEIVDAWRLPDTVLTFNFCARWLFALFALPDAESLMVIIRDHDDDLLIWWSTRRGS